MLRLRAFLIALNGASASATQCFCGWVEQYPCPEMVGMTASPVDPINLPSAVPVTADFSQQQCYNYCCPDGFYKDDPTPSPLSPPPPLFPPVPYVCSCGWTAEWSCPGEPLGSQGAASDDGSPCFNYCCNSPSAPYPPFSPSPPPSPPEPPEPPALPLPPGCSECDAGEECGYCLKLVTPCQFWYAWEQTTCGPELAAGEWCRGDGSCGTGAPENQCTLPIYNTIYVRVDCALIPPSPPPPLAPRPPAMPGEGAYLPAPPPPRAPGQDLQPQRQGEGNGIFDSISLPLLIVIIVLAVCVPLLLCLLLCYLCPGRFGCRRQEPATMVPIPVDSLGFGGTLVIEDQEDRKAVSQL